MMDYKGYVGNVEFDDEANLFHGEVINLRDVVTLQGETVNDLRTALQDSVAHFGGTNITVTSTPRSACAAVTEL